MQGEIMSFVFDANQLHSRVFLDQVMVPWKKRRNPPYVKKLRLL